MMSRLYSVLSPERQVPVQIHGATVRVDVGFAMKQNLSRYLLLQPLRGNVHSHRLPWQLIRVRGSHPLEQETTECLVARCSHEQLRGRFQH